MDKQILNVKIINFKKVDKPKGAGSDQVDKVLVENLGLFDAFFLAFLMHI